MGVVACRFAAFLPIPGAATCPFAAFPATSGRDARLIGIVFQEREWRGIKTLRLHQRPRRDPGFDEFVRYEQPQRLHFAAGRQTCVSEMDMGERILPVVQ
ncbi:MAG: hypothetical protein WBW81_16685 [Methylocella sp.]